MCEIGTTSPQPRLRPGHAALVQKSELSSDLQAVNPGGSPQNPEGEDVAITSPTGGNEVFLRQINVDSMLKFESVPLKLW